jgi:hypothetical protein
MYSFYDFISCHCISYYEFVYFVNLCYDLCISFLNLFFAQAKGNQYLNYLFWVIYETMTGWQHCLPRGWGHYI